MSGGLNLVAIIAIRNHIVCHATVTVAYRHLHPRQCDRPAGPVMPARLNLCSNAKEDAMTMVTRKIIVGILLGTGTASTPAFYVIQDVTTDRCRIVEERPAPNVGIVIDSPFELRAEAENHMRTIEVCHEGTTGQSADIIIDRRERLRGFTDLASAGTQVKNLDLLCRLPSAGIILKGRWA